MKTHCDPSSWARCVRF